jgi:hypothetical protein
VHLILLRAPPPPFVNDAFGLAGTPSINWANFNRFSATGACKPLFISRAEKLWLQTSDHELMLSSLILSKLQNCISTEGSRRITDTISNIHTKTATESQLAAVAGKTGIFVFLSREVAQSVKTESPPVFMADASETATAGQGPPKRRPPPQSDVKKPKVSFSALPSSKTVSSSHPPSAPSVVKACWSFLGQGSCKKGSKCKFSHDVRVPYPTQSSILLNYRSGSFLIPDSPFYLSYYSSL